MFYRVGKLLEDLPDVEDNSLLTSSIPPDLTALNCYNMALDLIEQQREGKSGLRRYVTFFEGLSGCLAVKVGGWVRRI